MMLEYCFRFPFYRRCICFFVFSLLNKLTETFFIVWSDQEPWIITIIFVCQTSSYQKRVFLSIVRVISLCEHFLTVTYILNTHTPIRMHGYSQWGKWGICLLSWFICILGTSFLFGLFYEKFLLCVFYYLILFSAVVKGYLITNIHVSVHLDIMSWKSIVKELDFF